MTRERIDEMVTLVLEARGRKGFSVSISIEKYEEAVYIYTDEAEDGIDFTTYTTLPMYNVDGKRVLKDKNRLHVYDENLSKAEEHVRRLLK